MAHVAQWNVKVFVFDDEDSVVARADLAVGRTTVSGYGRANWFPGDPNVPEIGDGVAASRALSHLAEQVMKVANSDLESMRSHAVIERRRRGELLTVEAPGVLHG